MKRKKTLPVYASTKKKNKRIERITYCACVKMGEFFLSFFSLSLIHSSLHFSVDDDHLQQQEWEKKKTTEKINLIKEMNNNDINNELNRETGPKWIITNPSIYIYRWLSAIQYKKLKEKKNSLQLWRMNKEKKPVCFSMSVNELNWMMKTTTTTLLLKEK